MELTVSCLEYETHCSQKLEFTVNWRKDPRSCGQEFWSKDKTTVELECALQSGGIASRSIAMWNRPRPPFLLLLIFFFAFATAFPLVAWGKDKRSYGEGLIVNIPMPERQVMQVVEDVAQNGVIRGTQEYNKDEFVAGAKAATSSQAFPPWTEAGKVFYKVREHAVDPRNFKPGGGDLGTLVVRYVVQAQGEKNTVLRIDAVFAEEYRHTVHASDGSVESSEYKDIRDHLDAIEQMEKQNVEAANERQDQLEKKQQLAMAENVPPVTAPPSVPPPGKTEVDSATPAVVSPPSGKPPPAPGLAGQALEEHVKDLRRQVERRVKAPGAALKSAPFHIASTLQSLSTGKEVLILIATPYWYGVETREGQRGWIMRDELEQP